MKPVRIVSRQEVVIKMENLCARSEQCSFDILNKVRRLLPDLRDCSEVMKSLIDRRFIDDRRFAQSFVNDKYKFARWGRRKIKLALAAKRISGETADNALSTIDPELYVSILCDLLRSKTRSISEGNTFEGRTKLFRFAVARGYEPDIIAGIIRNTDLWETRL